MGQSIFQGDGSLRPEVDNLKRVKVLLPSGICPPTGLGAVPSGEALSSMIQELQQLNELHSKSNILDVVGLHCSPGADLEAAAEGIRAEVEQIKAAAAAERVLFTIFVSDLDGRIVHRNQAHAGDAAHGVRDFVAALSAIPAQVFVSVSGEVLHEASLLVDRVLLHDPHAAKLTLQHGFSSEEPPAAPRLLPLTVPEGTPAVDVRVYSYKRKREVEVPSVSIPATLEPVEGEAAALLGVMPVLACRGAGGKAPKEFMAHTKGGEGTLQLQQVTAGGKQGVQSRRARRPGTRA